MASIIIFIWAGRFHVNSAPHSKYVQQMRIRTDYSRASPRYIKCHHLWRLAKSNERFRIMVWLLKCAKIQTPSISERMSAGYRPSLWSCDEMRWDVSVPHVTWFGPSVELDTEGCNDRLDVAWKWYCTNYLPWIWPHKHDLTHGRPKELCSWWRLGTLWPFSVCFGLLGSV